jgi:rhodanese-related sulfurtransferase
MIHSVTAAELRTWLDAGEAVVVDVRQPEEFEAGHIPGATLVPLAGVTGAALPEHKGRKLVMQCKMGGRSSAACQKLLAEDAALDLYNLEGGVMAWVKAGYGIDG